VPNPLPEWAQRAEKLRTRIRARGVSEVVELAKTRAREALWSAQRLLVLVRATGGHVPSSAELVLREATDADAQSYARDIGTDSPATFRARVDEGTRCWLVQSGARIVHATWMTSDGAWTRELAACVRPPAGEAYVYESFTHPSARGRGIYPFALTGIAARLGERGVRRLWVAVEVDNLASLRAVSKAGFEAAFEISYSRRLGRLTVGPPEGPQASSPARLRLEPRWGSPTSPGKLPLV
jgi:ribosomal protein S18 acetylase RimI-like enzyme